jgi:hypothetical protein
MHYFIKFCKIQLIQAHNYFKKIDFSLIKKSIDTYH